MILFYIIIYMLFTNVSCYILNNKLFRYGKESLKKLNNKLSTSIHTEDVLKEQFDFGKNFELPIKTTYYELELKNPHPNDSYLTFKDKEHEYYYNNKRLPKSVTQIIIKYFEKFETNIAIEKMINGKNWPRPQYMNKDGTPFTALQISSQWDQIGETARNEGTWMHYNIERFLNNLSISNHIPEMKQFHSFYNNIIIKNNIIPYRTEWRIAAPDIGLGGSIDFVGRCIDGSYVLMDWKRSKNLPTNIYVNYNKYAKKPLTHLPDCDGIKYSLQLNIYRYILMNYYGINISKMILVSFHPDINEYYMVEVPLLEKETKDIINDIIVE